MPVISGYTQHSGRAKGDKGEQRLKRWRKIALEAAKQSGRGAVPDICGYESLAAAAAGCGRMVAEGQGRRLALVPYESEQKTSLKTALISYRNNFSGPGGGAGEIYLFIGPEGGFSKDEIELCTRSNITPVTLGPRTFRSETAGLAAICQIMYEFEY